METAGLILMVLFVFARLIIGGIVNASADADYKKFQKMCKEDNES